MVLRRALHGTLAALLLVGCGNPCEKAPGCVAGEELPPGLLSVRAPAADDVWVVGSSPEPDDSTGPALLHFDGEAWEREDTSAWPGRELWWIWVDGEEQVAVGDGGLILEGSPGSRTAAAGIPEAITFFGVWGASAADVWAVGMETDVGPALFRRLDGTWAQVDSALLPESIPSGAYFKVEGTAEDDVWVVGSSGLAMHFDGSTWTKTPTDTEVQTATTPLLTVSALGDRPVAVGGFGRALILEWDGTTWRDASPEFQPGLNGVCTGAGGSLAVGQRGTRIPRVEGTWTGDEELLTELDWHGCDVDPEGGLWAVGGRIGSRPLMSGVLAYQGEQTLQSSLTWP